MDDPVMEACEALLEDLETGFESAVENLELNKKQQKALIEMYLASVNEKDRFEWLLEKING